VDGLFPPPAKKEEEDVDADAQETEMGRSPLMALLMGAAAAAVEVAARHVEVAARAVEELPELEKKVARTRARNTCGASVVAIHSEALIRAQASMPKEAGVADAELNAAEDAAAEEELSEI